MGSLRSGPAVSTLLNIATAYDSFQRKPQTDMDSMLCLVHASHGANIYIQRGPQNISFYIAVRTRVLGTTVLNPFVKN